MKGRRRNDFFKTVDDSKIYSNLRARLKLSEDRSSPSREKPQRKKGASNNFALTQAENKRKKQAEKRTVAKPTNKQAWTEKLKFDKKFFFFFFFK